MIRVFTGDNDFEITRELQLASSLFSGNTEIIDGSEVELRGLPDLIMGTSLFVEKRLVIVKNLSANKTIWPVFGDWIPRVSEDIDLILVEPKLDKRTKVYKELQKQVKIQDYAVWTERQSSAASRWAVSEAEKFGYKLDNKNATELVRRSLLVNDNNQTVIDQWRLYRAVEKLRDVEKITLETIDNLIDSSSIENVFDLFSAALKGDIKKTKQMIETLTLSQEPHRLFGLLSGQVLQLAVLTTANKSTKEVAGDLGMKGSYALENLEFYAKKLGKSGVKKIIIIFVKADEDMKSLGLDPWLMVEQALLKVAAINK